MPGFAPPRPPKYPPGRVVTRDGEKLLCCPKCLEPVGKNTLYFEDISSRRRVVEQTAGVVFIDGYYETDGDDESPENERFGCGVCPTEFTAPPEVEVEFQ
jgi:hypothetical protein